MAGPTTPSKRAPRKATPRKAATATAGPKVVLDLDTLSKQKAFPALKLPKGPFTFLLDGVQYELGDPRDTDWKLAMQLASKPFLLMRTALVDADEPVDDPTEDEIAACRERHGLPQDVPPEGSDQAKDEAERYPDGIKVCVIDRFAAAHLPSWKLNALFENWHQHYQIDLTSGTGILAALLGTS